MIKRAICLSIATMLASIVLVSQVEASAGASQGSPPDLSAIQGVWALFIHEGEAAPPPAPPVYASQRSEPPPPPIEEIARVVFRVDEEPSGEAVFPAELMQAESEGPLSAPVPLEELEFDGLTLRFEAELGGKRLAAELKLNQNRFIGRWEIKGEQRGGSIFLVRRMR